MNKQNADEILALTSSEIGRLLTTFGKQRGGIVEKRAAIYKSRTKLGLPSAPLSVDEIEARSIAKRLLNGSAPDNILEAPQEADPDVLLAREQRAVDIVMKILSDKNLAAKAAEAVIWSEENAEKWRILVRETVLTAIRLDALEKAASALLNECPDIFAVRMPMGDVVGGRAITSRDWETPVPDLSERALSEKIITKNEIKKAVQLG